MKRNRTKRIIIGFLAYYSLRPHLSWILVLYSPLLLVQTSNNLVKLLSELDIPNQTSMTSVSLLSPHQSHYLQLAAHVSLRRPQALSSPEHSWQLARELNSAALALAVVLNGPTSPIDSLSNLLRAGLTFGKSNSFNWRTTFRISRRSK